MEKVRKGREKDKRINEFLLKKSGKEQRTTHKTVTYGSIQ